eukprot:1392598-Amorphochlora_amoeboformis.AAC.1
MEARKLSLEASEPIMKLKSRLAERPVPRDACCWVIYGKAFTNVAEKMCWQHEKSPQRHLPTTGPDPGTQTCMHTLCTNELHTHNHTSMDTLKMSLSSHVSDGTLFLIPNKTSFRTLKSITITTPLTPLTPLTSPNALPLGICLLQPLDVDLTRHTRAYRTIQTIEKTWATREAAAVCY